MLPQTFRPFNEADAFSIKIFVKKMPYCLLGIGFLIFEPVKIEMIDRQLTLVKVHQNKGRAIDFPGCEIQRLGQSFDKGGLAGTQITFKKDDVPSLKLRGQTLGA